MTWGLGESLTLGLLLISPGLTLVALALLIYCFQHAKNSRAECFESAGKLSRDSWINTLKMMIVFSIIAIISPFLGTNFAIVIGPAALLVALYYLMAVRGKVSRHNKPDPHLAQ